MSLSEERFRMLGDPGSGYFKQVESMLKTQIAANESAAAARETVILPVAVSNTERAALARQFRWKLEVRDYGIMFRGVPYVAALVFLMGLRNFMLMGADGEEAVFIDGDVASLVAKGISYGHVCRTYASPRLQAGYQAELTQLEKMSQFGNQRVADAAKEMLKALVRGDTSRVCEHAASCKRVADTVFINHGVTPASLAQAVATANAHSASAVRGVAFFQPEMLTELTGPLQAFPGTFVVDKHADLISFLPAGDVTMGFSHPYSSLMSLFVNHEYVSKGERWLIEKHLSGDGIYHYILRKEKTEARFSEVLSANYYSHDLTKWVELTYTSFMSDDGTPLHEPRRVRTRLLEACYERTMSVLMYIDVKSLTRDKVFSLLKSHNNRVICHGDTPEVPTRVWYDALRRAVVPMHALAVVRRAEVSREVKLALENVRARFGLHDMSAAAVLLSTAASAVKALGEMAVSCFSGDSAAALDSLVDDGVDMSVVVERSRDKVEVRHMSGADNGFKCGRLETWLPAPAGRNVSLLARARAAVGMFSVAVGSSSSSCDSGAYATFVDTPAVGVASGGLAAVEVAEVKEEPTDCSPLSERRARLLEDLVAKQDAFKLKPPARLVERYIGPERADVPTVPLVTMDPVPIAQEEYDQLMPGVSQSDEEMKPVIATQCDVERRSTFKGVIDDSKRLVAPPRWVRRSRLRTGGAGRLPKSQLMLFNAVAKRNTDIPDNRGVVDLSKTPGKVVDAVIDACYVDGWRAKLEAEIDAGLWLSVVDDIREFVPKVSDVNIEKIVRGFVTADEEDMYRWTLMLKAQAKPPMDPRAHEKLQAPQTIMYSEQKVVNAKYSAMQTRFYRVMKSMLRPNISFNNRDSPAEHEVWFNSCQGLRESAPHVYPFAGDLTCYDRSQEFVAKAVEAMWFKRHGLDAETLAKWSETHGVKKATCMMYGIVMFVFQQGLSGIWKTLFRNGLLCLGAVVYCADLKKEDIVSLDVVGDDFLAELLRPVNLERGIDKFTLTFNFTAKLTQPRVLDFCSKVWIYVDGWWYFVQNPMRKIESVSNAVSYEAGEDKLEERWVSLCDDLRHYDNAVVMDALGEAVALMYGFPFAPVNIIRALGTFAADKAAYLGSFGPEELLI